MAVKKDSSTTDDPKVLAYRVGQLEVAVKEGFDIVTTKIDNISKNFVSKRELEELEERASIEHRRIEQKIKDTRLDVDSRIDGVKQELEEIRKHKWVQNTLSAILGAALTILVANFLANLT